MAKGDVVSAITQVASGANLDYQPAAGVEAMITEIWGETGITGITAAMTDGTNTVLLRGGGGLANEAVPHKWLFNNSRYLRLSHSTGSNKYIGYCGIQTK